MAKKRSLTPAQSLDPEKDKLIPPVLPEGKCFTGYSEGFQN